MTDRADYTGYDCDELQNEPVSDLELMSYFRTRVGNEVVNIIRRVGEGVAPHDLRRTFTGDLLNSGIDLSVVSEVLGHRNPAMTGAGSPHGAQRSTVSSCLRGLVLSPKPSSTCGVVHRVTHTSSRASRRRRTPRGRTWKGNSMNPQLLRQGWSFEKARDRRLELARPLVDQGLQWRRAELPDYPSVEALVSTHVDAAAGFAMDKDSGAIVVEAPDGAIVAALVVGLSSFGNDLVAIVRYLAVDPAWRGRGIGTVTLGVLPQLISQAANERVPNMTIGNCEPAAASYYQRAGFSVTQPGELISLPYGNQAALSLTNEHYPCWIFRQF